MIQPEMKLIADVIPLWSFLTEISGDKIPCKHYPK